MARCLASIREQDYPQDQVDIFVADGGSTDDTLKIARRYECRIVDASGLLAEAAKEKALELAETDFLAMIDADNTIVGRQWLTRAIEAFADQPTALGFESYYSLDPADPALNRYLTGLLQISDPWARAVATRLKLQETTADGVEVYELPRNGSYPTGANGFLFRRQELQRLDGPFHEATFFPELMRREPRTLLKHADCQVHHDYVRGWRDYYRKKQRVAMHYLLRSEEVTGQWDRGLSDTRRWLAMIYCASVVGPALESARNVARDRRWEWWLHAPASFVGVAATVVGVARSRWAGSKSERRQASRRLKPKI